MTYLLNLDIFESESDDISVNQDNRHMLGLSQANLNA